MVARSTGHKWVVGQVTETVLQEVRPSFKRGGKEKGRIQREEKEHGEEEIGKELIRWATKTGPTGGIDIVLVRSNQEWVVRLLVVTRSTQVHT